MDPTTTFCPNVACPARGQIGQGNIGIHSCKDKRFICTECRKTFSATKGTAFYRLRTSAETVSLVMTLLAHGCPLQAIVVAFGYDERTVAGWVARGGAQGQAVQEHLVEQPRDLGQVQADEIRVKKQGGIVWMALAMMVKTRLWLGGEVSEQRDMPVLHPSHSGELSRPRAHKHGWTPPAACMAECLDRPSRQALRAAAGRRNRTPHCRWHAGPRRDTQTALAGRRGHQYGLH